MENNEELSDFAKKILAKTKQKAENIDGAKSIADKQKEEMLAKSSAAKSKIREIEAKYFHNIIKEFKSAKLLVQRLDSKEANRIMDAYIKPSDDGIVSNEIGFQVYSSPNIIFLCGTKYNGEIQIVICSSGSQHVVKESFGVALLDEKLLMEYAESYFDTLFK